MDPINRGKSYGERILVEKGMFKTKWISKEIISFSCICPHKRFRYLKDNFFVLGDKCEYWFEFIIFGVVRISSNYWFITTSRCHLNSTLNVLLESARVTGT